MPACAKRITPQEARSLIDSGDALLVCGYDDEEKCRQFRLNGSISMKEFRTMADSIPKDRGIVFYCD